MTTMMQKIAIVDNYVKRCQHHLVQKIILNSVAKKDFDMLIFKIVMSKSWRFMMSRTIVLAKSVVSFSVASSTSLSHLKQLYISNKTL